MAVRIKSDLQITKIRKASEIIADCFEIILPYIKPGNSTKDLERVIEDYIIKSGGIPASKGYCGFPGALCISVNEELIHGIPSSKKILKDGDIVSLDIMVWYDRCVSDATRTYCVGNVKSDTKHLLEITKQSFFEGIKFARKGNHINDISKAIQKYVESNGYSIIKDYIGHGVGIDIHEEPEIPNYDVGYKGVRLEPGMVLAIEPMVSSKSSKVKVLKDKWTVVTVDKSMCSHYENTVLITDGDPEVLTLRGDKI